MTKVKEVIEFQLTRNHFYDMQDSLCLNISYEGDFIDKWL